MYGFVTLPLYLLPFTSYVVPRRHLSNPIELGLVLLVRPLSVFLSKATTDFHQNGPEMTEICTKQYFLLFGPYLHQFLSVLDVLGLVL